MIAPYTIDQRPTPSEYFCSFVFDDFIVYKFYICLVLTVSVKATRIYPKHLQYNGSLGFFRSISLVFIKCVVVTLCTGSFLILLDLFTLFTGIEVLTFN